MKPISDGLSIKSQVNLRKTAIDDRKNTFGNVQLSADKKTLTLIVNRKEAKTMGQQPIDTSLSLSKEHKTAVNG